MLTRRSLLSAAFALTTGAFAVALASSHAAAAAPAKKAKKHVLVVTTTTGFRHYSSIALAREVIAKLGDDNGLWETDLADVDTVLYTDADHARAEADRDKGNPEKAEARKQAEDKLSTAIKTVLAEKMSVAAMKKYDTIIFANTTGELPLPDPQGFLDYIKAGHGFAAMHAGGDTFHTWATPYEGKDKGAPTPYVQMLGGEFETHHAQSENELTIRDPDFPAMKPVVEAGKNGTQSSVDTHKNTMPMGGTKWKTFEETYIYKNNDPSKVHVLLDIDHYPNDQSPDAGKPGQHLIAWSKMYGKGRIFYTALGHRDEMWRDAIYQQHILGGIKFALGLAKGSTTPGNYVMK